MSVLYDVCIWIVTEMSVDGLERPGVVLSSR